MNLSQHPCFDQEARSKYARVHLPVATRCNAQCHYCDRNYSCVNESRPGVSVKILTPAQALTYVNRLRDKMPNLSVVGIAGPGDPFANPKETLATLRLIREQHPDLLLCVATNGLNLVPYIQDLAELRVAHVTITVNAVDADIGARVYAWLRYAGRCQVGRTAAQHLWEVQSAGIKALKEKNIIVKINTIYIPGINDGHITTIAGTVAGLKADLMNIMPLYPVPGTPFGQLASPAAAEIAATRRQAGRFIPQLSHCTRCRADACGLLGKDDEQALQWLREIDASADVSVPDTQVPGIQAPGTHVPDTHVPDTHVPDTQVPDTQVPDTQVPDTQVPDTQASHCSSRPFVAVTSWDGMLINQHLGEARQIAVYNPDNPEAPPVSLRTTPPAGLGDRRWQQLVELLSDCSSLLTAGAGPTPTRILRSQGIEVHILEGLISTSLHKITNNEQLQTLARRQAFRCGAACQGNGMGCG